MLLHTVKVYPSKIKLPKKKQLAWKIAEIASDNVALNKEAIEMVINRIIDKNKIDHPGLLKEGENVSIIINSDDNNPLSVDMPLSVVLEVTHTEPGIKGNTATNATKPATLETGASINVPLFINEGDKVKIDTEKGQYIERIK